MFLVDIASHQGSRVRQLAAHASDISHRIIEDAFPAEPVAVWQEVCDRISNIKPCERDGIMVITANDRRLMHLYAANILKNGSSVTSPSALHPLHACKIKEMVAAVQENYRRHHPIRTRLRAA